jgi:hypothetical protein
VKKSLILLFCLLAIGTAYGQPFSIGWYKIAGGGGASTSPAYSLNGTIGQHDASPPMTSTTYSLVGGFWSIIAVPSSPGIPNLVIQYVTPNSVQVLWPANGNYTLQQNGDLTAGSWAATGYTITTANGTNSITITPPTGNLFFRLSNP